MSNIAPTVGRVVYYKSYGTPNGEYSSVNRAAIITEVITLLTDGPRTVVGLCVLNPEGMFFNRNVEQGDKPGQWDWMPFQKGQAQKNEELEKTVDQLQNNHLVFK